MILYRWQGAAPNFGDELNTVLWPRLLPGFFDDNPDTRFLGIGSVLDGRHPAAVRKVVAGSGYGGYEPRPVLDERWTLHWVRGPRTAAALGLPEALGLGDPAALLPMVLNPPPARGGGIGFMPHFESIARGAWQQAARQAGVVLIDPRDPPVKVLAAIRRCDMLLSEALHGVIVADAFRVPWVAVRPLAAMHRAKWADWAATIGLIPRFISLPASTAAEWLAVSPIASLHAGRAWIAGQDRFVHGPGTEWLIDRAARALARAARAAPQLSADAALDRCQSRMAGAIAGLQRSEGSPSHLRTPLESAYQPEQFG